MEQHSILVVDDNEMNRDMLSRRLKRKGYSVSVAVNGRNALEMIKSQPFDLILLDIMMPEMDGYQVLEEIKKDELLRHIPVIMITALDAVESAVKCIKMGAEDHIAKPFNPVLLNARVSSCLWKKKLHDRDEQYRNLIENQNQILEERVREQVKEITMSQLAAIFSMSKLSESRDPETGEHLERMQEYVPILLQCLRQMPKYSNIIDQKYIDNVYAASPLHDIGKVGVPDHILLKQGKLTEEEWEIMKTHTIIGAQTLSKVNKRHPGSGFIKTGIAIAGSHHEKWNGTGYPCGISGEDIPLEARAIAIGDVYDALTSKRCYKEEISHEKSIEIILSESGTQFDPDIVKAFIETSDEFKRIRSLYRGSEEKK